MFAQHGSKAHTLCSLLQKTHRASCVIEGIYVNKALVGVPKCFIGARRGDWWLIPSTCTEEQPPLSSSNLLATLRPLSQQCGGHFNMPRGQALPYTGDSRQ